MFSCSHKKAKPDILSILPTAIFRHNRNLLRAEAQRLDV